MRKTRIDEIVRTRLRGDESTSTVTRVFLEVVAEQLALGHDVFLGGFGRLKVVEERASPMVQLTSFKGEEKKVRLTRKLRVHFKKGAMLKHRLDHSLKEEGTSWRSTPSIKPRTKKR